MHWNFHCSSWTGCHRLDWLAQWIDVFFLLASWPLHNSVLVLLKSKSESLTFLQKFTSQLFRPEDWDDLISNGPAFDLWNHIVGIFASAAQIDRSSHFLLGPSLRTNCRLCGMLICVSFISFAVPGLGKTSKLSSTSGPSQWRSARLCTLLSFL